VFSQVLRNFVRQLGRRIISFTALNSPCVKYFRLYSLVLGAERTKLHHSLVLGEPSGPNCTNFGDIRGPLYALPKFVSQTRNFASFRNWSASKAKLCTFRHPPCKIRGELGKMSESVFSAIILIPYAFLDSRYIAPFRNHSASKANRVEN